MVPTKYSRPSGQEAWERSVERLTAPTSNVGMHLQMDEQNRLPLSSKVMIVVAICFASLAILVFLMLYLLWGEGGNVPNGG